MSQAKSPAQLLFNTVLKETVTPIFKPLGFRKSGVNYHRRHGECVQVLNFQSSYGSSYSEKLFYINVGIAFDAVYALRGKAVQEKPKESECASYGMRYRLEKLFGDVPSRWTLLADSDVEPVKAELAGCLALLSADLNQIETTSTFISHRWFTKSLEWLGPADTNATLLYLNGQHDKAWDLLQWQCARYAARRSADAPIAQPRYWVEKLGLIDLLPRC